MAKILIIDDAPEVRALMKAVLEGAGHSVAEAQGAVEGLTKVETGTFDLLMTDIIMPGMDGVEIIKRVRRSQPDIRIIAMSAGSERFPASFSMPMSQMHGADATLLKPVPNAELLSAVEEVLGSGA